MIGNDIKTFKAWCHKVLPLTYDDSLSYYEYLCKVTNLLNQVITQMNILTESEENFQNNLTSECNQYKSELTDVWTQYKNYIDTYFENLNVQNEINNKLDIMASDGSLTRLIAPYLGYVTPEMFGAKGDGITDDTVAINNMLSNCYNKIALFTKTYLINGSVSGKYDEGGLVVKSNTVIRFTGGAKIIEKGNNSMVSHIFILCGCENVDIGYGILEGDYYSHSNISGTTDEWCHGIRVLSSKNINIHDMVIKNCYGDGIYIGQTNSTDVSIVPEDNHCRNITLSNITLNRCGRNGISLCDCNSWNIRDIRGYNINRVEPKSCIDVELEGDTAPYISAGTLDNIFSKDCTFGVKIIENPSIVYINNSICNTIYPYNANEKIYINNCLANLSIYNSDAFITNSEINSFTSSGNKMVQMKNCKLTIYQEPGIGAKCDMELDNCIINGIYNFDHDLKLFNCTLISDGSLNYNIRLVGAIAIIDNCTFVLAKDGPQNAINDSTSEKLTVKNCKVTGISEDVNTPFISTSKTCYIDGNNYFPFNTVSNITPITGCVNFRY